jgi:hypothetical protein
MINFYDGYVSKGCFPMNRTQSNMQDVIGMYVKKKSDTTIVCMYWLTHRYEISISKIIMFFPLLCLLPRSHKTLAELDYEQHGVCLIRRV